MKASHGEIFGNRFVMQTVNTGVSIRIFMSVWIWVMEIFGNRFVMQMRTRAVIPAASRRIFLSVGDIIPEADGFDKNH